MNRTWQKWQNKTCPEYPKAIPWITTKKELQQAVTDLIEIVRANYISAPIHTHIGKLQALIDNLPED